MKIKCGACATELEADEPEVMRFLVELHREHCDMTPLVFGPPIGPPLQPPPVRPWHPNDSIIWYGHGLHVADGLTVV